MRKKFHRRTCGSPHHEEEMFLTKNSLKRTPTDNNDDNEPYSKNINKGSRVLHPHENDVLMGRGGKNNQHSGNEKLRGLARERCQAYQVATKKVKSRLSKELVHLVRTMDPPGRFLRKVEGETAYWEDVGDDIAREKTSQVLRDAVQYQMFGPNAKTQRNPKIIVKDDEEGPSPAGTSRHKTGQVKSQSQIGETTASPSTIMEGKTKTASTSQIERQGNQGLKRRGTNLVDRFGSAGSDAQEAASTLSSINRGGFSPMWNHQQQRELRADAQHFWPGSPDFFAQQSNIPPPYLGMMRDPASATRNSLSSTPFGFQMQQHRQSFRESFHVPSVTPAASVGDFSSSSSAMIETRKRPRQFETPMSSPSYYGHGNTGNVGGQYAFSSPREHRYGGQHYGSLQNTPSVQTNTSPMIIASTPPFTSRNVPLAQPLSSSSTPSSSGGSTRTGMNISQPSPHGFQQPQRQGYCYSGSNDRDATDMLCSPHDVSSRHRSPNMFHAGYFPGAKFATANSPGAYSNQQSPVYYNQPPAATSGRPPLSGRVARSSSSSGTSPWSTAMVGTNAAFAATEKSSAALFNSATRSRESFDSSRTDTTNIDRGSVAPVPVPPLDFLQEIHPMSGEMTFSDSEREGAISPFPFSSLKLEQQEE